MTAKSDTFFAGPQPSARKSRPRRPPPVIDQDGNEVHVGRDPFGQDAFGRGGFGADPNFGQGFSGMAFGFGPLTRAQRFARIEALARLMDVAFVLPGTNVRYGIDGLIGLIPVVGDLLTTAISLWLVREARALGAPAHLIARMLGNVALDGVVGLVPFAGDAFDVVFRANMRNIRMLRRWMDKQPRMD
ncbi:DUF4112 domain-containing protein [Afipia carboxidovorans]|uniref:DUF4112 domain-containing protein n=1 Tax=Afipia carboxidovorans TaxID=40137 RepID=UPI00308AE34F|nr:DUF4112 domain-containing protein [Afipia carboxidovorans]